MRRTAPMPTKVVSEAQALQAFRALDVDGSGSLTVAELAAVLQRPGEQARNFAVTKQT